MKRLLIIFALCAGCTTQSMTPTESYQVNERSFNSCAGYQYNPGYYATCLREAQQFHHPRVHGTPSTTQQLQQLGMVFQALGVR